MHGRGAGPKSERRLPFVRKEGRCGDGDKTGTFHTLTSISSVKYEGRLFVTVGNKEEALGVGEERRRCETLIWKVGQ